MQVNENRLKRAFYSSVSSAVYQVVVIICGYVTSRLIVQTYGSSWNGVLASITKFLGLFSIVEVGINGSTRVALYRAFAKEDIGKISSIIKANDDYYKRVSIYLALYVIFLAFLVPLVCHTEIEYKMIFFMVIIVGISKFAENCWGINSKILLAASQSSYITNIALTLSTVANALLLILIIHFGGSILLSKAGSSLILVAVPIALFVISRHIFHVDKHATPDKTALKSRWDVLANSLSNIVHENVDIFFLTIFCASTELSVYAMYYVVAEGLTKIFQVIINGVEAGFGNMWTRGQIETLKKNLRQFEYIMYSLAALLFGCMTVLIVPFMGIYMQGITDVNYIRFSLGLAIAIAQVFMSVRTPYVLVVQAAGHYKQVKIGAYTEVGINIVLTCFLVIKLGIVGAIIGTICANVFRTIQYGWYVSTKMIHRNFMDIIKRILWLIVVFVLAVETSLLITNCLTIQEWLSWIIASVITFLIHAFVIVVASLLFYRRDLLGCVSLAKRIIHR